MRMTCDLSLSFVIYHLIVKLSKFVKIVIRCQQSSNIINKY